MNIRQLKVISVVFSIVSNGIRAFSSIYHFGMELALLNNRLIFSYSIRGNLYA
jgi:hypothetical protein